MITKQQLIDRGFIVYAIWGWDYGKAKIDDKGNMFSINVKFKGQQEVQVISLDCYIGESSEGYSADINLPVNTPIEDIDHLIRLLNL